MVLRTLRSATGGASEWRPPLVWCRAVPLRRAPVTTGGRLNSPSGAGVDPGTHGNSCARAGHSPWASCWRNHLKAGAHVPAMDYVTSSRARASLTTARALQQEYLPHCDNMSQLPLLRSL